MISENLYPVFAYTPDQRIEIGTQKELVDSLKSASIRATLAYERLDSSTKLSNERLKQRMLGFQEDYNRIVHSQEIARNYFLIKSEFESEGATADEAYCAFKTIVAINMECWKMRNRQKNMPSVKQLGDMFSRSGSHVFKIRHDNVGVAPSWFKGTDNEWKLHLTNKAIFTIKKPDGSSTVTFCESSGLPDWFDFRSNTAPSDEVVKAELEEDQLMDKSIHHNYAQAHQQGLYLHNNFNKYTDKVSVSQLERYASMKDITTGIPGLVLSLDGAPYLFGYKTGEGYSEMLTENQVKIIDSYVPKEVAPYVEDPQWLFLPEFVSYWTAKSMIGSKFVTNTYQPFEPQTQESIKRLIANPEIKYHEDPVLTEFQQKGKERFNLLYYRMRPFFSLFDDTYRKDFAKFFDEHPDAPAHYFIYKFGNAVGKLRLDIPIKGNANKDLQKSIDDLSLTTRRLLVDDHHELYLRLLKEIEKETSFELPRKKATPIIQNAELDAMTEEMADASELIDQGSLSGWEIVHTSNPAINTEKFHTVIGGESIEERVQEMTEYLRTITKLPISSELLIEQFESIVDSKDDVAELTRGARIINGQRYRRRRKDHLRIFYQVNPADKKIVFFLHKKEAQHYQGDRKHI